MDRRIATIAVIAVMMTLCMSPVFADESDADSTTRVSEAYVYKATAIAEANPEHISSGNISMIFIDGSENDQMMDAYLADPENMSISVIDDDRDALGLLTEDTPINLYRFQSYVGYASMSYNNKELDSELVLEPYMDGMTFFVKAGDRFELTATLVDNTGRPTDYVYIYDGVNSNYFDGHFEKQYDTSSTVRLSLDGSTLYYDVTYTASGYSLPNGSPTMFVAICAGITVVVLGILVYAGLKPKWSK